MDDTLYEVSMSRKERDVSFAKRDMAVHVSVVHVISGCIFLVKDLGSRAP